MDRDKLFRYVQDTYGTEPEYLWKSAPDYAVLRHVENPKWYGIVMYVEYSKLGMDKTGMTDILDVKCDTMQLEFLTRQPGFLPGYHMNHRQWLTILLDGSVPDDQILDLLDQSYQMTESNSSMTAKGPSPRKGDGPLAVNMFRQRGCSPSIVNTITDLLRLCSHLRSHGGCGLPWMRHR